MKAGKILVLAAMLAVTGVAQAQFSSTVTGVSDYDFRGVSLTARGPALQASADYAFGESGFAVGAWASNIDAGPDIDGDVEVDVYAGFNKEINDTFGFNAGIVYYTYPDSDDIEEYPEAYVGFTAAGFGLKQWYSNDFVGSNESALYTEANYSFELPANLSLALHAGYSYGDAYEDIELMDYSVGLNYTSGDIIFGVKYTGTDASGDQEVTDDLFNNEPRFLVSISTTLPWGKE